MIASTSHSTVSPAANTSITTSLYDRRNLISRRRAVLGLCASSFLLPMITGCKTKPKLQCASKDQLSLSQHLARQGRRYVEIAKNTEKNCTNCALFKNGEQDTLGCGICGVDGLPAHPLGHCTSWARQSA